MNRDSTGKYVGILSNSCQSQSESEVESRADVATDEPHSEDSESLSIGSSSGFLSLRTGRLLFK